MPSVEIASKDAWIPLTDVEEVYRLLKKSPLKACGSDDIPCSPVVS